MHPKLNNMNHAHRASRKQSKFHKEELAIYIKTKMAKLHNTDQYYKRAVHSFHGICQMWYEVDSDGNRDTVDTQSSKFRGYDTAFN